MAFSKIMVGLDLSSFDEKLIQYSRFIATKFETKTIDFLHVIPAFLFPEAIEPISSSVNQQLAEEIQLAFGADKKVKVNISVLEGKIREQLLGLTQIKNPNLLILGKKKINVASGITARRVAQKTNCAILFVTENASTTIKNILVPIDFSDYAYRALQTAIQLKEQLGDVTITALHVIETPNASYKINRNKEATIQHLKNNAQKDFDEFLAKKQLDKKDFKLNMLLNDEYDVARYVHVIAEQDKSDLIIIGAKGRSRFEGMIFGSVAEKLVTYEATVPVLIVR